ncbi:MAG: methyl-accepting chemotaxis protein [Pseudomonas sp.]
MRFMSSLRLQSLTLLVGSLLLMLVISIASVLALAVELRNYRTLIEGPLATADLVSDANVAFKEQVQEWKNVLLRGADQADLDRYWSQFQASETRVQTLLTQIGALDIEEDLQRRVTALRDMHGQLGPQYRSGLQRFVDSDRDPIAGDSVLRGIDRETTQQLGRLADELHQFAASEAQRIREATLRTVILGIVILLGSALFISILASVLLSRRLVTPITDLVGHMEELAMGRFDEPIANRRTDELGILARSADQLRCFLRDTAVGLNHSTRELDQASGGLNSVATKMAHGSREQFSRTDQVATAIQEMAATAAEVARHAADAAGAANAADDSAREGRQTMNNAIDSMQNLLQEVQHSTEVIRQLEGDSHRIGKVLEVIQSVAEQTNLLALNAAIEAARAGEAGRGFAVVADEVRTLARRTSESTHEIQQIITSVQQGAQQAVKAIDAGRASSDNSMQQVTLAGNSLQQIARAVESIRDMNRQIATAAEEQTSVSEDISRNITEITDIAATNQQQVEYTAQASETLQELSAELNALAARLHSQ